MKCFRHLAVAIYLIVTCNVTCELFRKENPLIETICSFTLDVLKDYQIGVEGTNDTDWCLQDHQIFNFDRLMAEVQKKIDLVNSTYNEYHQYTDSLKSRVSKTNFNNTTIDSLQTIISLEIVSGGLFISDAIDTLNDTFTIYSSVNTDRDWISLQHLEEIESETLSLLQLIDKNQELINDQVIFANRNDQINGSCCVLANMISLDPAHHIHISDLTIKKDSDNVYLDGEVTWGFIKTDDIDRDILDTVTFNSTVYVNTLESPSIGISAALLLDHEPIIIRGPVIFTWLHSDALTVNYDHGSTSHYNLSSAVEINGTTISDLAHLNFDQVIISNTIDSVINGVNMTDLFTEDTDQYLTIDFNINEVLINGSELFFESEFGSKVGFKLIEEIASEKSFAYDCLTLDSVNVSNIFTDHLDDWMLFDTDRAINFGNLSIDGWVNFDAMINDLNWDDDLTYINDETDLIDEMFSSSLIFKDLLIISKDLGGDLIDSSVPDNWTVEGDLTTNDLFNNHQWDKLINDLVYLQSNLDYIEFMETVEVSNCDLQSVNDIAMDDVLVIGTVNITQQLKFESFATKDLILVGWNLSSCLFDDDLFIDEGSSFDQLDVIELQSTGLVNGINTDRLMVNGSNQIFTQIVDPFVVTSDVTFNSVIMTAINKQTNLEIYQLNGLTLNRLLRSDPKLSWPETVILRLSNITNLTNRWISRFISKLLIKEGDQLIPFPIIFDGKVAFGNPVYFPAKQLSINFQMTSADIESFHFARLEIDGSLTLSGSLYDLNNMITVNMTKGMMIGQNLTIKREIRSTDKLFFSGSSWHVHQTSKISPDQIKSVDNFTITGDLQIKDDDQLLPWLKCCDSLDGIEHYSSITLQNKISVFTGNINNVSRLGSADSDIKLEEIAILPFKSDLQFNDSVTIDENLITDHDIYLTKVCDHNNQQILLNNQSYYNKTSSVLAFIDEILVIGDINYTSIEKPDEKAKTLDRFFSSKAKIGHAIRNLSTLNNQDWLKFVTSEVVSNEMITFEKLVSIDNVTITETNSPIIISNQSNGMDDLSSTRHRGAMDNHNRLISKLQHQNANFSKSFQ